MVSVHPMRQNQSETTAELIREVVSPLVYYSPAARQAEMAKYTPSNLEALIGDDEYSVLVAELEEAVVGFCISRYDDGIIWLAWFGVSEVHRGEGTGAALLTALDESTIARGCGKIWCDTRTENVQSQNVLSRAGFTKICSVSRHWYGHDFFLWEKFVERN